MGVPEIGIPILEPAYIDLVDFKIYNLTIQFQDIKMKGFKTFQLLHSRLDRDRGTWDISAILPKMSASGYYKMFGTIPPNIDLGRSEGDQRDRKSTRLNSSHSQQSRMPSSA